MHIISVSDFSLWKNTEERGVEDSRSAKITGVYRAFFLLQFLDANLSVPPAILRAIRAAVLEGLLAPHFTPTPDSTTPDHWALNLGLLL